ncbi:MAG: hypothetical protein ACYTXY_21345, partial [Nostoc sp.]
FEISSYRLSEVQEPHPQPPKSKRGGGYDVPHVIRKRYKHSPLLGKERGWGCSALCIPEL